uniref:Uncharacterized protein n=1 Tax=Lepeophtheirus salmonis TaxID=72036 RepID=A0A0K2TL39_LEPSM
MNIAAYLGSKKFLNNEETYEIIMSLLKKLLASPEMEQMTLLFKKLNRARFLPCLLWQNVSTALYDQIFKSISLQFYVPNILELCLLQRLP